MKKIGLVLIIFSSIILASNTQNSILEEQLKKQMAKEKKYAYEQTFYQQSNYDFKGSEVNPESLKNLNPIEVEELDMDNVYD